MRRLALLLLAAILAAAALGAFAWRWYARPSVLTLAVVRDSSDAAVLAGASKAFGRDHEDLRFQPMFVDSLEDSAAALEDGRADLAVVRGDVALPPNGQTVVLMRHNAAVLVAPGGSALKAVTDLRNRRIGVLRGAGTAGEANRNLLDTILAQYELAPPIVQPVDVTSDEIGGALTAGHIDAVMLVGVPGAKAMTDSLAAVVAAGSGPPVFLPVPEAKGIAARLPAFEATQVVRGVFGGAVPKPPETFDTIGVTTRLVARDTLNADIVSTLTRLLLAVRPTLSRALPLADRVEAPDEDRGAVPPVHPGTLAYLGDDEQTFFDKYSDAIYIGAMLLSALGSAAAAAAGRFNRRSGAEAEADYAALHQLIGDVRHAPDPATLERLEARANTLLQTMLRPGAVDHLGASRVAAVGVMVEGVRAAAVARRGEWPATPRQPFEPRLVGEADATG